MTHKFASERSESIARLFYHVLTLFAAKLCVKAAKLCVTRLYEEYLGTLSSDIFSTIRWLALCPPTPFMELFVLICTVYSTGI